MHQESAVKCMDTLVGAREETVAVLFVINNSFFIILLDYSGRMGTSLTVIFSDSYLEY
jgi:hypothetical protein